MLQIDDFKKWLKTNTAFSDAVIGDTASRMKRADTLLQWNGEDTYLFYLEKEQNFQALSMSVRSQIRKAVKLYTEFVKGV